MANITVFRLEISRREGVAPQNTSAIVEAIREIADLVDENRADETDAGGFESPTLCAYYVRGEGVR